MAIRRITIPDSESLIDGGATPELLGVLGGGADLSDAVKDFYEGTIVDAQDWQMMFVEDGEYSLSFDTPMRREFFNISTDCDVGSCTATVKINGVALGGTANSVTTSKQRQAHSSSNVADPENDVTIVISSNSGCEGMRLSAHFRRPLIV